MIAVANMKGGVGKTTTVVMLAEGFAAVGMRVLVVDLDAQSNVSYCFAPDDALRELYDKRRTITSFLDDRLLRDTKPAISTYIAPNISNVTKAGQALPIDLIAAHPRLRMLEREIIFEFAEKQYGLKALEGRTVKVLQDVLPQLRATYDLILFDCAPGISAFTEVAIRLSDLVIVPTIPDFLSTLGFDIFQTSIWGDLQTKPSALPKPKRRPAVLATRVDPRKTQHKQVLAEMKEEAGEPDAVFTLFDLVMHSQAAIERAMDPEQYSAQPTFVQKWGNGIQLVRDLMDETWRRLND
ncbi:ParA family protein [Xanthobacter sp. V4C-4]|uniref:ParA family protein n=1 Tax=Xanthobacter cornucopiae TaxID=3119924 RepID=UPI0037261A78